MRLEVSDDLVINLNEPPFDTEGLIGFFCGKTGAGKSYALIKVLEQAYRQKYQFVFLDPHGEGHVLADQTFDKRGGITVISERYGIPVDIEAIPVYVSIIKSGQSVVIDLSKLFKKEKKKFNEFVERFIREFDSEWSDVRTPILIVIDEAHYFAPQKIRKGDSSAAARVDLITDLSTGGRKYGISQIYSTQRPALIDKTPVTQANFRMFGKVTSTQDWNAIKDHVKDNVGFTEIKGFTSGMFIVNIGDETKIVKVAKRETKDAGMTPTYKAQLSSKAQLSADEITKQIRDAIESARADREQTEQTEQRLKTVERENVRLKTEKKEMQFQLETVAIVERRLGKTGTQVEVREVVAESFEEAKMKMRGEFDGELRELRKRHQTIVDEKDKANREYENIIAGQSKDLINYRDLQQSLLTILGNVEVSAQSIDEDAIVKRVLARVPTGGQSIVLEAPAALASAWEQKQLHKMLAVIDELAANDREAFDVFSYMLVTNKILSVTAIARGVFHSPNRTMRNKTGEHLKTLSDKVMVKVSRGHGYKHNIEGFIKFFLGNIADDLEGYKQHITHRIAEIG